MRVDFEGEGIILTDSMLVPWAEITAMVGSLAVQWEVS